MVAATDTTLRRKRYAVIARASREVLEMHLSQTFPDRAARIETRWLQPPEPARVPVEVEMAGGGGRALVSEVVVTRAILREGRGFLGYGYIMGNEKRKAACVAWLDLLGQLYPEEIAAIVATIDVDARAAEASRRAEIEATRVDFMTLLRGDNPS